ncbi:hypothetical protein TNIN_197371 [Trichonephila inaurata madagascariensis]|uniref:Uncharacterized protein n=1 Tax=Trichonephila inaurata madagascariensis TaxID=2747483 RepID=A0A8X6YE88_9ARAC|nr:hypothetical protein TNIN_197371 [Trichonephila inaurata madagascariensis]
MRDGDTHRRPATISMSTSRKDKFHAIGTLGSNDNKAAATSPALLDSIWDGDPQRRPQRPSVCSLLRKDVKFHARRLIGGAAIKGSQ